MDFLSKKVLVVEDDHMLRKIIVDQLRGHFYVLEAKDGQEALDMIMAQKPDAITLDLLLPKKDGFQVLDELRKIPDASLAAIPIVVISNLADPHTIKQAQDYGVAAYFTKSDITLGSLIDRIKTILSRDAG